MFTLVRVALLGVVAAALGFEFHGTPLDALAALVVLVVLAAAMSALFGRIGDRLRRPDVVQFAGMMIMMPFMFISPAFAPLETMPSWMRAMAALNPVAHATDALRGHVLGGATAGDTAIALATATARRTARQPPIYKGLARREMINVPRPTARSKSPRQPAKACGFSRGGSLQLGEAQTRCGAASAPERALPATRPGVCAPPDRAPMCLR